jgi:hypothetical protein
MKEKTMGVLKSLLMVLGAAAIVSASVYTLGHLTDRVIASVLVPGVVVGLILIVLGARMGRER